MNRRGFLGGVIAFFAAQALPAPVFEHAYGEILAATGPCRLNDISGWMAETYDRRYFEAFMEAETPFLRHMAELQDGQMMLEYYSLDEPVDLRARYVGRHWDDD